MSQLCRTPGCFPFLGTCLVPSDTMKASPQRRDRSVQLRDLWALCLSFVVSSVIETYLLLWWLPPIAVACMFGGVSRNSPGQKLKRAFHAWPWFLLGVLWLLEETLLAQILNHAYIIHRLTFTVGYFLKEDIHIDILPTFIFFLMHPSSFCH